MATNPNLPKRFFAQNEEPTVERVNNYHKIKRTAEILDALDPDEVEFLRGSTFGKILVDYDNPTFSGAFGYIVIQRQLRTLKKYELWFLFAGNPIRISLREFAIVTGLKCDPVPTQQPRKRKNPLKDKLYWNELFGSLKTCTTDMVIEMLKLRVVKDRERRIKFACLAVTSSVLLPTSHTPKIVPEHVELIRDLQDFLDYPWGRVSYSLLVSNLIKKDEVALSQDSIAIQGYVDAIQRVLIAAVPQLKEEVATPDPAPVAYYDSEGDTNLEDIAPESQTPSRKTPPVPTKYVVIPGHAKTLDFECKVKVHRIIPGPDDEWLLRCDFSWPDEVVDPQVDTMLKLIAEGFRFRKDMFTGGVTAQDLYRIKLERQRDKETKEKNDRENVEIHDTASPDQSSSLPIANIVADIVKDQLGGLERRLIDDMSTRHEVTKKSLESSALHGFRTMQTALITALSHPESRTRPRAPQSPIDSQPEDNTESGMADETIRDVLGDLGSKYNTAKDAPTSTGPVSGRRTFSQVNTDGSPSSSTEAADLASDPAPTKSAPVVPTSEEAHDKRAEPEEETNEEGVRCNVSSSDPVKDAEVPAADNVEGRKSKRSRQRPAVYKDYQCDPKPPAGSKQPESVESMFAKMVDKLNMAGRVKFSPDVLVPTGEFLSIAQRTQHMSAQVMDSLMLFLPRHPTATGVNVCFCDTSMPAILMDQHARLVKTAVKDRSKIKILNPDLCGPPVTTADRLYFPFNLDKKHWVGICVDTTECIVYILDCNTSFKTESQMKKELNPIAVTFPYILRARDPTAPASILKPFSVVRCGGIAQNNNPLDAGITTVLLIKGHSAGGLPGCKAITPAVITEAAQLFVVRFYQFICDNAGLPKVE